MSACKDTEDIKDWSDHIARPHGWILGIPNKKSIYYEYFYNKKMSSKEDVISDFTEFLGIQPEKYQYINNYFADDIFVGERTIINGSRHYSLEPLESMSLRAYKDIAMKGLKYFFGILTKKEANKKVFDNKLTLITNENEKSQTEKIKKHYNFEGDPCDKCGNFTMYKESNKIKCLTCNHELDV